MLQRYETEKEYTEKLHELRPAMIVAFRPYANKGLSEEKMVQSFENKIGSKSEYFAHVKSFDMIKDVLIVPEKKVSKFEEVIKLL